MSIREKLERIISDSSYVPVLRDIAIEALAEIEKLAASLDEQARLIEELSPSSDRPAPMGR